jgi:modulator of FtsH protease
MGRATSRSESAALALLLTFGLLIGLALAPALSYYANADSIALWQSGAATGLFVAAFGSAGYGARRDLSTMARAFWWGLFSLLVFGVVLIFVDIPHGALVYAVVGLAIFAGLTAFDFQRLRRTQDIRTAPLLAASIFLDALNVFLLLLSLFGGTDR